MYMLTATLNGKKYRVLRHDPSLERTNKREAVRASWADFYPMAKIAVEIDTFEPNQPGYNEFYDAVTAWTLANGGRSVASHG